MTRYQWPPGPPTTQPDDPRARADYEMRHRALIELLRRPEAPEAGPAPARAAVLPAAPTGGAFQWLPIGPSTVLRGQAGGRPRVSGRVRDVAVDDDGRRIYAATATGGVWYSEDSGTTWSPLGGWVTDANPATGASASALSCGCLHVEFNDPAAGVEDVVYVGTGELVGPREGTGSPGRRMRGVGVLRLGSPLATVLANPFQDAFDREAKNLAGYGIYRIARDPANPDRLVAATSAGLFTRTGPFVQDADWTRVTVAPFNFDADDGPFCTDVLWNPGAGAVPARLWVALVAPGNPALTAVYVSTAGVAGPFARIALAGAAATATSRLGLAATPFDRSVVYVLGSGPALWRIDGTTPRVVGNVPTALFGATSDQSDYDLAIAVKPDTADRIVIGGSTLQSDGEWSASLFRCTVTGPVGAGPYNLDFLPANDPAPTTDPTYVGNGVHADVHQVRWLDTPLRSEVWVACDGGLFRSRRDGDAYSFAERSTGLAALECSYVANHQTIESVVMTGTQDNGIQRRIGDTLWQAEHLSDGGGVVLHRAQPLSYIYQHSRSDWRSNDPVAYAPPVVRTGHPGNASELAESGASEFYSGAAIRATAAAGTDRIVLGSTRVWISEDWSPGGAAMTWGTLPSGAARVAADPRAGGSLDSSTDNLRGIPIVACRWVTDDRVVALGNRAVHVWTRAPAGVGVWTRAEISFHDGRTKSGGRFGDSDIESPTSPVLPPLGGWSDIAVHQPGTGANGTYYVATTGHASIKDDAVTESTRMDTLWWYDGTSLWHPTGLRNAPTGMKAPAYAVAVDPGDDTVVYVGTALGVWHGLRSGGVGTPTWTWQPFGDGLPEAPVEDLSFFSSGATKLLRAAVRALGVWELDLSAAPVAPGRVYLRAHADDRRRALPSDRIDPAQAVGVLADWGASPDIRVRPSPLNPPPPAPPSLGPGLIWSAATPPPTAYDLWVLQLALHFGDATVRPTGVWDAFWERRLRAFRVANGQTDVPQVDATTWTNANDVLASWMPPWDGVQATEADLHELIVERRAGPPIPRTRIDPHQTSIDVLVHRRDVRPVPDTTVRAMLLRRRLDPADLDGAGVAIDAVGWPQAVIDRLTGAGAPAALPAGWDLPAGAPGVQGPSGDLDARRPRPVTFTADWSGQPSGSLWLLVAVVSADADPVSAASLAGATLLDLVLGSHHVAVRRVEVI